MHLKLLKVKSKTRQPALIFQRHIFGGAHLEGYDHQIQTRPRFLYNAPTPSFISYVYSFRNYHVDKQTHKQTDAAKTIPHSSLCYDVG